MTRREWIASEVSSAVAIEAPQTLPAAEQRSMRIAAITTVYHHYSHADVLVGRLLQGYSVHGEWAPSRSRIVSVHADQQPVDRTYGDQSRNLAACTGFRLCPTIRDLF